MPYYQGDYYRGDYYRGDYYRGDPGFFSFIGKALGGLAKGALNIATGGQFGGSQQMIPTFSQPSFDGGPPQGPLMLPGHHATLFHPFGGAPGGGQVPGAMRGFHANKSAYITRGGGTSRWPASLQFHPRGTVEVRNRRMNVGNARALRRALHRVSGFARLARRVMSFTHPGHGRGRFKFHRKRKRA
jgi:hypothetical protein